MSMTDEQCVKWLLQKAYESGHRYMVMDEGGEVFLFKNKPSKRSCNWYDGGDDFDSFPMYFWGVVKTLVSWEDEKPFDIGKYLGLVDWENVPADTKVFVSDDGENWRKRYFKHYDNGNIRRRHVCFADGRTSWSNKDNHEGIGWEYCKLAEDE